MRLACLFVLLAATVQDINAFASLKPRLALSTSQTAPPLRAAAVEEQNAEQKA